MRDRVFARLLLAIAVVTAACATNPVTGEREIMLVSEAQEIEIGRANDEQIVAYYGLYEDAELAAWVDSIGQRMAAASERPDLPWTFRVVDDTAVNAFALPGGFIYLTRGILSFMTSEAEVAGVLGHEIGHVTARHSAQQISRAQLAQIGLGVGSIVSPEVRALGGILQTGVGLLFLKFGRDDESQADELGVRYAAEAGFDPRQLANFFSTIDRLSERGGGRLPTWLSTHPDPQDRQQRVLEMSAPFVAAAADLEVGRDQHFRRIDGMVFGPDPREGLMVGDTFKHPELLFQLDYPSGWTVQNGKTAVVAAPENGEAILGLTAADRGEVSLRDYAGRVVAERQGRVTGSEEVRIAGSNGLVVEYLAEAQGVGTLRVRDLFVDYRGLVYDLVAYTRQSQWGRYAAGFGAWQASFRPLPQDEARRYEPDRLDVFAAPRSAAFQGLVNPNPAADLETLALINGLTPAVTVDRNVLLKRVTAGWPR